MQPIAVRILGVLDHREDTGGENEENIEEVKEDFITMKGNSGIFKILKKKVAEK